MLDGIRLPQKASTALRAQLDQARRKVSEARRAHGEALVALDSLARILNDALPETTGKTTTGSTGQPTAG